MMSTNLNQLFDMMSTNLNRVVTSPAGLRPRDLRPFYRGLYRDASPIQKLLTVWRASICPLEPIVRFVPWHAHVLDFGCGSGALLALLSALGRISTGVGCDISAAAIHTAIQARKQLTKCALEFHRIVDFVDLPQGPFDVVLMIDVLHHIPAARQEEAFLVGAERVKAGGTLIYKDMASQPAWRRFANSLHDLLLARQLVSYVPAHRIDSWARKAGLLSVYDESYSRLVYAHELRIFRRMP